jgi:lysophospholipase L1-like esterase
VITYWLTVLFAPLIKRLLGRSLATRKSQLEVLPKVPGRIVFLGDSITEGGLWDEWFAELAVANRGIGGDTVGGVLDRLDSAVYEPRAISVLIGTNDLSGLGKSRRVEDIAAQLDTVLSRIRTVAPDALLIVNSVMPRAKAFADDVTDLNHRYQKLAATYGATYLDLWPALAAPDRSLRKDLTLDGLHLSGAGYQVWVDQLRPLLAAAG